MKSIITIQNEDGTYDEVGMNNRRVISAANWFGLELKARQFAKGKKYRMQSYKDDRIGEKPSMTRYGR